MGYTGITESVLSGSYNFSSAADNAMLDLSNFCERHGYTYFRSVVKPATDRLWGYAKGLAIKQALQEVELLIVADFDTAIADHNRPIEDVLAGWGFNASHLLLAPEDPDKPYNRYEQVIDGVSVERVNLNIGFMALRRHERVAASLDAFSTCVDLIPECEQYRWLTNTTFSDQTAWNRFILPMFSPSEVVRAPCNEGGGNPEHWGNLGNDGCNGTMVHHAWGAKEALADMVRQRVITHVFRHSYGPLRSMLLAERSRL